MKRTHIAILIGLGMLLGASPALADREVGEVQPTVITNGVHQKNQGIENENSVELGTVKMKTGKSVGNFRPQVRGGTITQTNDGIKNKNKIKMGTVE